VPRKEPHRRCATCANLDSCRTVTIEMLKEQVGCSLWRISEELAKDAREEIEIEFGPVALALLTTKRGLAPTVKKGRTHVRRTRKATP